jgi:hypothetical protein
LDPGYNRKTGLVTFMRGAKSKRKPSLGFSGKKPRAGRGRKVEKGNRVHPGFTIQQAGKGNKGTDVSFLNTPPTSGLLLSAT